MIDRLIHHAEILSLKGDSYRLRGKDLEARPTRPAENRLTPRPQARRTPTKGVNSQPAQPPSGLLFNRRNWPRFQPALTGYRH